MLSHLSSIPFVSLPLFHPGLDVPLVNNYGVWMDEFAALGMSHTLERTWPDAVCYFGEGKEVRGRWEGYVSD